MDKRWFKRERRRRENAELRQRIDEERRAQMASSQEDKEAVARQLDATAQRNRRLSIRLQQLLVMSRILFPR